MPSAPGKNRQVYRLTDLEVGEVSLVDRPANMRPFLMIKRRGDSMPKQKVTTDGRGNHTTAKADTGAPDLARLSELAQKAAKREATADELAELETLSAAAKAQTQGAEGDAGAGDGDTDASEAGTAKRGRLSRGRRRKLREVVTTLAQILSEVEPAEEGEPAAKAKGGKAKKADKTKAGKRGGTRKADKPKTEVEKLREELAAANQRIDAITKGAPVSHAMTVEDDGTEVDVEGEGWPIDMNSPVTKRGTPKTKSFFSA